MTAQCVCSMTLHVTLFFELRSVVDVMDDVVNNKNALYTNDVTGI